MTWLFAEVWVWSIAAFLVGALMTWLLFVRPLRRRLDDALDELYAEPQYQDADYDGSGYYSGTSGSLPAEYPDRVGPESLNHRDWDEEEPTFGDWDRPRGWSPPPDTGVHEEPHQPVFDWDQSGRPRSVQPSPAAAAPQPEPTDQFHAPAPPGPAPAGPAPSGAAPAGPPPNGGAPSGPAPAGPPPSGAGMPVGPETGSVDSGSGWFQTDDPQGLAPEDHGSGPEGRTDMFRPVDGASSPAAQASMTPPVEPPPVTPDEGHTEMFRSVEGAAAPSAVDSNPRQDAPVQDDAAPTGQLRSLFEPLVDGGAPAPSAASEPTDAEMTQHIPRVETSPEQDPREEASTEMIDAAALPSSPGSAEPGEPVNASAASSMPVSAQPEAVEPAHGSADLAEAQDVAADAAGGTALPRRKPGAGPRPGAQNFNTASSEQAAEQESFTIKGHFASRQYHTPESPQYERVIAEVWFRTRAEAEQAGFEPWDGKRSS